MDSVVTTVSLSNLAGGAVEEQFQFAFAEVMKNIHDPNTPATRKRSITITITFEPTGDRSYVEYSVTAKPTLQAPTEVKAGLFSGQRGGRITVAEYVAAQGELDFTEEA